MKHWHKCYEEVCSEDWRWYGLSREVSVRSEKRRLMMMGRLEVDFSFLAT